jgi:predicted PurR-regulated permease PerM
MVQRLSSSALAVTQFVASRALGIGQDVLRVTALFFLMLYILFFFLRDGNQLVATLIRVLPLGDVRERQLLAKFAEVSLATIKGTLVVGIVQGAIGGALFWILGIPAPVFWGTVMAVFSVLPAVGPGLVWGPAAVILLGLGEIVKGIVLIAAGAIIIGLVDNVLRPILVGRDTQMPDYLVLLSTLGGLAVFGISGFVIGPVIAALFLVVWEMFAQEHAERTASPGERLTADLPEGSSRLTAGRT